ncbi:unnamed protein product [Phytophthora fragariaefolia]|uniref:Unnamed protein product n=1 Tax=Phytophthora fragariaefolia TaxID=1490495 RepID=A0A9W6U5H8_9STRA|nr:unnamed protein product [Phytophthora fragariaefolia]
MSKRETPMSINSILALMASSRFTWGSSLKNSRRSSGSASSTTTHLVPSNFTRNDCSIIPHLYRQGFDEADAWYMRPQPSADASWGLVVDVVAQQQVEDFVRHLGPGPIAFARRPCQRAALPDVASHSSKTSMDDGTPSTPSASQFLCFIRIYMASTCTSNHCSESPRSLQRGSSRSTSSRGTPRSSSSFRALALTQMAWSRFTWSSSSKNSRRSSGSAFSSTTQLTPSVFTVCNSDVTRVRFTTWGYSWTFDLFLKPVTTPSPSSRLLLSVVTASFWHGLGGRTGGASDERRSKSLVSTREPSMAPSVSIHRRALLPVCSHSSSRSTDAGAPSPPSRCHAGFPIPYGAAPSKIWPVSSTASAVSHPPPALVEGGTTRAAAMKLAKAAAQQLKAVVLEYDVLCSSLLGQSAGPTRRQRQAEQAPQRRVGSALSGTASVQRMQQLGDVRGLLQDLGEDSSGRPWEVQERLRSTLQGLPSRILDRVTGADEKQQSKSEDELHLEQQLQAAAEELAQAKRHQEQQRQERQQGAAEAGGSSLRDKYMDKINKLKQKKKQESERSGLEDVLVGTTSAGLSTWVVNDGANEVLVRRCVGGGSGCDGADVVAGVAGTVLVAELLGSARTVQGRDPSLSSSPYHFSLRHNRAAGTHVCHYMPGDKAIPNHTAHYHLTHLNEFQHLVEDFNGVSYRDKIKMGSIEF